MTAYPEVIYPQEFEKFHAEHTARFSIDRKDMAIKDAMFCAWKEALNKIMKCRDECVNDLLLYAKKLSEERQK